VQTRRVVRIFGTVGAAVSVLVVLLYGLFRGGWLDAVLAGIAVGMSMLPEEFPVVLTVFLAMGAWRISRERVLTRRATAIEALGSATVLCTDKTGTLTENRMAIVELRLADGRALRVAGHGGLLPPDFSKLVRFGGLASALEPFDPMEVAFHQLAARCAPEPAPERTSLARVTAGEGDIAGAEAILRQAWAIAEATEAATERAHVDQLLRQLGIRTWRRGARARQTGDLSALSDREREIANLLADGASNPDIASALFLSRKTVERHVSSILGKLDAKNRAQVAAKVAAGDTGSRHRPRS